MKKLILFLTLAFGIAVGNAYAGDVGYSPPDKVAYQMPVADVAPVQIPFLTLNQNDFCLPEASGESLFISKSDSNYGVIHSYLAFLDRHRRTCSVIPLI